MIRELQKNLWIADQHLDIFSVPHSERIGNHLMDGNYFKPITFIQSGYHISGPETGRNCSDVFLPIPEFKRNSVPLTKEENRGNFLKVPEKIPVRLELDSRI
jgi:hypothetical protein